MALSRHQRLPPCFFTFLWMSRADTPGTQGKTHTLLAEIVCNSSGFISEKVGNTLENFQTPSPLPSLTVITTVIITYHHYQCYHQLPPLPLSSPITAITTVITNYHHYHCYHQLPPLSLSSPITTITTNITNYPYYHCHHHLLPLPLLSAITLIITVIIIPIHFYQPPTSNGSQGRIPSQRRQITSRIVFSQPAHQQRRESHNITNIGL